MTNVDSQRIKEIRDNTARIADAFNRIADEIQLFREAFVANNMSICESCANNPCNKKAMLGDRRIYECTLYERAEQTEPTVDKDINVRSKTEPSVSEIPTGSEPQTEEWHTWQDEQEYNDRWQTDCAWK